MKKQISVEEKLSASRTNIILNYGFFSSLLMHLNVRQDNKYMEQYGMTTMATNGDEIIYHENFIQQLTVPQINFALLHEILHVALGHLWRRGMRNPELWNVACDFVVNNALMETINEYQKDKKKNSLRDNEKVEPPEDILYDTSFAQMSAEEVYKYLEDNIKSKSLNMTCNGQKDTGGNNFQINGGSYKSPDDHRLWDEADQKSEYEKKEKQMEWSSNLIRAAEELKRRGLSPSSLSLFINNLTKPQKNWKALLRDFIDEEINDYSFAPPDRRYDIDGIMLPDFNDKEEIVKDVLFFVDTSGSMSVEEITACYSELQGAINQFNKRLHGILHFFDATVKVPSYNFDDVYGDLSKIIPQGGGGTDFEAVFKYINANRAKYHDIKAIIIMTDGRCDYPNIKITNNVPVLWIFTTKDNNPPFGKSVMIKV